MIILSEMNANKLNNFWIIINFKDKNPVKYMEKDLAGSFLNRSCPWHKDVRFNNNALKETEFLSQTLVFKSLYLCNSML